MEKEKDYIPVNANFIRKCINKRDLERCDFKLDCINGCEAYGKKSTIVCFDLMFEFRGGDPGYRDSDGEEELNYYIPTKLEIISDSASAEKEIQDYAEKHMKKIMKNIYSCFISRADSLIISDRMVTLTM